MAEKSMIDNTYVDTENPRWYVMHTNLGYENVAIENLKNVIENSSLQNRVFEIVCPTETVVETNASGKKKTVERKLMPTYIFVKMIYGNDIWHALTRTRGVTGFVGPKGWPLALTDKEVENLRLEKTTIDVSIEEGDNVTILDGVLKDNVGVVQSIDKENEKCKVVVEMFGRENVVDLDISEIKKI